jgi:hypothetical protein
MDHPYGKRGFGDRLQRMVQGMGAGPQAQAHFDQFQTNHPHFAQHLANRADQFFQGQPDAAWSTGQGPLSFANFLRYRAANGQGGAFMPNTPTSPYQPLPAAVPSTPGETPAAAPTTSATGNNGFAPDPSGGGFGGDDDRYAMRRRRR